MISPNISSGKAQVSVEYLLIIGLAFLILIPGGYLFYNFSQANQDQVVSSRINKAGMEIIDSVDAMFAVGQNSWTTLNINFPSTVTDVYILNETELVIKYDTAQGPSEAVYFSKINMTTPFPGGNITDQFFPGVTKIKIASVGSTVLISEVK